jgi:hypothetical protein
MKKLILPLLLLLVLNLNSQTTTPNVVSTSGGFYANSTASLSVTVGELTSVSTISNASINLILTQGFQQNNSSTGLPVKLIKFTGTKKTTFNYLNWSVVNEIGIDKYEVQSSVDGNSYSTIATIKATNSGSVENTYSFIDSSISKPVTYYRLLIYDRNGTSFYSWVVRINSVGQSYKIYPNPVKDELTVELVANQNKSSEIQLFDMQGKLVFKNTYYLTTGNNIIKINLTNQVAGTYLLQGLDTDGIKIIKN